MSDVAPGRFARLSEPLLFYRETSDIRADSYRQGCASDRRLVARHGPALVGPLRATLMVGRSCAVESATLLASRAGLVEPIIRLRSTSIGDADRHQAQVVLERIRASR